MPAWKVVLMGGVTFTAETPEAIVRLLSKAQWDDESRKNVKRALAWRTWVATRTPVDEDASDADFLLSLADAGVAHITVTTTEGEVQYGDADCV